MISVIIPTKDDPEVFNAIKSVQNQTYDNYELIVVDASENAHRESLQSFCENRDITYIYQPDHDHAPNLNGARNLGVENSKGNIIALMDGDCTAEKDWLESLSPYFENHDIVECNVSYVSKGKKSPLDRTVENKGRNYGFLGAGLAFKRKVWEEEKFDEDLNFHDDTAFGLTALNNNFAYTYGQQAKINHHAGKFSAKQFILERLRFKDEAKFFKKFKSHERINEEVSHIGNILHPKELAMLGATIFALGLGWYNSVISGLMILGIMLAVTLVYYNREDGKRDLDFCPIDLIKLFFLAPFTFILVKRYAIWAGAIRDRIPVV